MGDDQETRTTPHPMESAPGPARNDLPSTVGIDGESTAPAPEHLLCPSCHEPLRTRDVHGEKVHCAKCGNSFRLERPRDVPTVDQIRVIGRFQLLDRVGHGSFGTVWRARDTQLDRVVALKVPHHHALAAGVSTERLEREARVAAQLRHPGIVRLYEIVTIEGIPTLVSDFIDGVPLHEWLETHRPTFRESALLVAQVAEALDHAHEHGLVHRDVKPANIMIERACKTGSEAAARGQEEGSTRLGKPILVDFGLARRPEADIVMTMEGDIIGTPAYMSPEQAAGQGHSVDCRADVYSLGVVLYQLLCGELPFRGSKGMLLQQILQEDPRPPRRVNDRIPRDLETICLKTLAKSPARRYATAGELAADLRRYLRGEPCLARPVGRLERGWLWALRNPALAGASAATAILLLAVVVVSVLLAIQEKQKSRGEAEHARRLKIALDQSEQHLRATKRQVAENYLDRGVSLCERGDIAPGMLLLARGLLVAPAEARDLARAIRSNLAGWEERLDPILALRWQGVPVKAVAFSPDGSLAASAGADQKVWLWRGDEVARACAPIDASAEIACLAFAPDGHTLAIARRDGKIRLWDVRKGSFAPTVFDHHSKLTAMDYSHDGKVLASGGPDDDLKLWDTATLRQRALVIPHGHSLVAVKFAGGDKTVICATDEGEIQAWDLASGSARGHCVAPRTLLAMAQSPDGRWLATCSSDWSARLWDAASLKLVHVLPHSSLVRGVAFSPDSRTLLTGNADKVARLWDVETGRLVGVAAYHAQAVGPVAFSPAGNRLLTASDDGVCQLRAYTKAAARSIVLAHKAGVGVVCISPDGRTALSATKPFEGSQGEVRLWDFATGKLLHEYAHAGMITSAAFSGDSRTVASASADRTVRLVDVASGKAICPPLRHQGWVHAVAFSPDGTRVLTGCDDRAARLWDVATGRYLNRSFEHRQGVVAVAFSPDGALALTGSADGTARLWDIGTGEERHVLHHQGLVREVAFGAGGTIALSVSLDQTARVWRVDSGTRLGRPLAHRDEVLCGAFSPDGRIILTGSKDKTAQLWKVATSTPLGQPFVHSGSVYAVAFSPDGMTVATASADATVRLWDIATCLPLGPALAHGDAVTALQFSPDGRRLLTGSRDTTARIWEIPRVLDARAQSVASRVEALCGMALSSNEAVDILTQEEWQTRLQAFRDDGPRRLDTR